MRSAEVIAIGNELLSGETVDTNSNTLDRCLERWGWRVFRHTTVPDEVDAVAGAYVDASARSELVISTGGLGPTQDDLTMAGLAQALGVELVLHEPTLQKIKKQFESVGREMSPNNRRQAMVPAKGEVLENLAGTAPGFRAELGKGQIFLLPGVPREVRYLVDHALSPRLDLGQPFVHRRTAKVIGLGESRLEHTIRDIIAGHPNVCFGFRTRGLENHIKLEASGAGAQEAIHGAFEALSDHLGDRLFGADAADLSSVLGDLLREREETLAAAESCTGGLIAKWLTDTPSASKYFLGGVVAYDNAVKKDLLGVDPEVLKAEGAVSEAVARQMAEGVRQRLRSTYGVSSTGIAGPSGGTEHKPVGLVWIAVAGPSHTEATSFRLPGHRDAVRSWAATAALASVRLMARRGTIEISD